MPLVALPSTPPEPPRGPVPTGGATILPFPLRRSATAHPPRPTRVLVVAHRPLIRASLRALLDGQRRLEVVGDAGFDDDPAAWARALRPDVAVVVPDGAAAPVAAARRFAAAAAGAVGGVLVVTDDGAGDVTVAPGGGVIGLLSNDAGPHELTRAVEMVARGRVVLAPTLPTPT